MDYSQLQPVLAANIQAQTIAERDYKKAQAEADKWEELYQRLLKGGQEDLIQEAQFYKSMCAKKAHNLKALLDEQTKRVANLRRNLTTQKKTTANSFTINSTFNSLEQTQQITDRFKTTSELSSNDLKTRLRKVESELEAMKTQLGSQQIAIDKLLKQNSAILEDVRLLLETSFDATFELPSIDKINQSISLEPEIDIDDELENLKKALVISISTQNHNSLPNADTVEIIDADLEQLRSHLDNL